MIPDEPEDPTTKERQKWGSGIRTANMPRWERSNDQFGTRQGGTTGPVQNQ